MKKMVLSSNRDIAIDYMKFFAVLLVMNSHMDVCYTHFSQLSTGGILGDALFFFASGFGLFLGKPSTFTDWYKKRIRRIFPSVIAASIVALVLFDFHEDIADVLICERYWFLQCILLYYLFLFPIKKIGNGKYVSWVFCFWFTFSFIIFCFSPDNERLFYGGGHTRIVVFFMFMLMGAYMGKNKAKFSYRWWHLPSCLLCLVLWALICFFFQGHLSYYFSIVPFLGFTLFSYLSFSSSLCKKIYNSKIGGMIVYGVSQLCLECYLIQKFCYSDLLNFLFPFNIFIFMGVALFVSYFVKVVSEFILQTLNLDSYNWKNILLKKNI